MSTEDNENRVSLTDEVPVSLTDEVPSEATTEEPIEQVTSQETTDTIQSSERAIESEDQERFEETAKFEEEIEDKPSVSRQKSGRKETGKAKSKLISNLHSELRRYSDARKKTDVAIKDIQRQLKELNKKADIKRHQAVRDLQADVKELQRKIDRIDRSIKSSKPKTSSEKTSSGRKK